MTQSKTLTFGEFIKQKRVQLSLPQSEVSRRIGITTPFLSRMERGLEPAFGDEKLVSLAQALDLTGEDKVTFYDLAGWSRGDVPYDIKRALVYSPCLYPAVRDLIQQEVTL